MFRGKTLLITGGTGTFGNAVLERFLGEDIRQIRVFSRDEKKQEDMRLKYSDPKIKFYLGDVRQYESILPAMHGVDYVFHAAALKQVPSCEFFPLEAIKTNSLGAENVMNAACVQGVEKVIVLSTDKAVYPINAMGLSKALMEKLMVAKARDINPPLLTIQASAPHPGMVQPLPNTVLCGTRYGNVMMSRGSVIALFIDKIKSGEPLPVTDPDMTRFMMSIGDAVDLVIHAFSSSSSGSIFVLKSPAATIQVLAEALKELFNSSVPINIIGTRHGEKKHETLVTREEMSRAIDEGNYYQIPMDGRDLNYGAYFTDGDTSLTVGKEFTSENTRRLTKDETVSLLKTLPEVREALL